MKLKIKNKKDFKLIKLELLKAKFFKTGNIKTKIAMFSLHLKQLLLIIYKFHLSNKKIFFFGIPINIYLKYKKPSKNLKHLFFPESYWEKGLLSNKVNIFKYLKKRVVKIKHENLNAKIRTYFLIKKKPDLIVILNQNKENISLLKEANKLKIPTLNIHLNEITSHNKKIGFIFALVYSILKKNKI